SLAIALVLVAIFFSTSAPWGLAALNYGVTLPVLIFNASEQSPFSKAAFGLSSGVTGRVGCWLLIIVGTIIGLGVAVPIVLQLATSISLHKNGIRVYPFGINRNKVYSQLGTLGREEEKREFERP
ncbi:MAG TPA: hypothetical protein VK171_10410, partial [Fimbriimonas sp.]|nr:hypothetical protein [Fimbriimonas sp.]